MKKWFVLCALCCALPAAAADKAELPKAVRAAIAALGVADAPSLWRRAPLDGFYEVVVRGQVVYVSDDGRRLLVGELFEMPEARNLSDDIRREHARIVLRDLDERRVVSYRPERRRNHIVVFTDVDCAYCRRFHRHMPELLSRGVAVDYVLVPYQGPAATKRAEGVWCAPDRNAALDRAKRGEQIKSRKCDNPIADNLALAAALGIRGTPAILLDNGTLLRGYMPPDALFEAMAGAR